MESEFSHRNRSENVLDGRSLCCVDGLWEELSPKDIERFRTEAPGDWKIAWLKKRRYRYRIAIQTIARWEERYLKEWIEYHLALGVERIFIYDNNDREGLDSFLQSVLPLNSYSRVEVIPWREPMDFQQLSALRDCVERHRGEIEWLLPIDVDEFLVLEKPMSDFLSQFASASAVYLSWESFNANGLVRYEDRPVMERFKKTFRCLDKGQGKVMFRPIRLRRWGIHWAELTGGRTVNSLNEEIRSQVGSESIYETAWIKHYFTKSLDEWNDKIRRGCADRLYLRRYAQFFEANPDLIGYYDPAAQQLQRHFVPLKEPTKEV